MSSITYAHLALSGSIAVESILDINLDITANQHATLTITGILQGEDALQTMQQRHEGTQASLCQNGAELPVFTGTICDVAVWHTNGYNKVRVDIASNTIKLDKTKKSRSFQNVNMTYRQLINTVLDDYGDNADFMSQHKIDQPIGYPIVQYRETDWDFLKRIASHFFTGLIPEVTRGGIKFSVGLQSSKVRNAFTGAPHLSGVSDRYRKLGGAYLNYKRSDFLYHQISSTENYEVGDNIPFHGDILKVCKKTATMKQSDLVFTYTLGKHGLVAEHTAYNDQICGMSLLGTVLSTDAETLKVHFDIDDKQNEATAYPYEWIPQTGNLMYLMPLVGTRVSVYFGSADERSAKAVACVRTNGNEQASQSGMDDYNNRALSTEHNANMLIYPEMMSLNSVNEESKELTAIHLVDETDIQLISPMHLLMKGAGQVTLEGKTVHLEVQCKSKEENATPHILMMAVIPMQRVEIDGASQLLVDMENTRSMLQSFLEEKACLSMVTRSGHTMLAGQMFRDLPQIEDEPQKGVFPLGKFLLNVLAAVVVIVAMTALTVATFGVGTAAVIVAGVGVLAAGSMLAADFNSGNARNTWEIMTYTFIAQAITFALLVCPIPFPPIPGFVIGAGLEFGIQMYQNGGSILDWKPRQTVEAGVAAQLMQQAFKLLPQMQRSIGTMPDGTKFSTITDPISGRAIIYLGNSATGAWGAAVGTPGSGRWSGIWSNGASAVNGAANAANTAGAANGVAPALPGSTSSGGNLVPSMGGGMVPYTPPVSVPLPVSVPALVVVLPSTVPANVVATPPAPSFRPVLGPPAQPPALPSGLPALPAPPTPSVPEQVQPPALPNSVSPPSSEISIADKARSWQGSGDYPGIDNWVDTTLKKGTIVWGGYPGASNFYFPESVKIMVGNDATKLYEGIQVGRGAYPTYRGFVRKYVVTKDIPAAYSRALANPQHGAGGLEQYYIDDFQNRLEFILEEPMENL